MSGRDAFRMGKCPMAMTMTGEALLAAPRDVVWAKLNDAGGPEGLHSGLRGA